VLSDLRESGALEQDADIVIFLHRNMRGDKRRMEQLEFEETHGSLLENEVEVIVAKHRHGPTGTAKLHFEPRFLRFEEIAA
jgi:replicative DNA helicase